MTISLEYYTRPFVDCDLGAEDNRCQEVLGAVREAVNELGEKAAQVYGGFWSVEYIPGEAKELSLGITSAPTLVFYDKNKSVALKKLSGSSLNPEEVKRWYLYLASLEPAPGEEGQYLDEAGKEVSILDLFGKKPGSFGLGVRLGELFNCQQFLPKWVCGVKVGYVLLFILLVVILILFIKKMR